MLQIKLGIELATLRLPLKKGLLIARELRAEAVEIDLRNELRPDDLSRTGVRHLRKMLDDLNLRVSAVAFRTRRGYAIADDLEARIEATKRAMTSASPALTAVGLLGAVARAAKMKNVAITTVKSQEPKN